MSKVFKSAVNYFLVTILLIACLAGCGSAGGAPTGSSKKNTKTTTTVDTTSAGDSSSSETSASGETSGNTESRATKKIDYNALFAPADDENDFMWANDYTASDVIKFKYTRDSKGLTQLLGYESVSRDEIIRKIQSNPNIESKYKAFLTEFIDDYLTKYPGADFRILYHNLDTMQILEVDENTMYKKALDSKSVACYKNSENTIYVQLNLDLSKENNGYIILTHELLHACRVLNFDDENGVNMVARFSERYELGNYTEELIATYIAYDLQGLNKKADYYTMLSDYGRIIFAAIDYDGADFLNHSVNYFVYQMDRYMGTEEAAYVCAMMEAQAELHFNSYSSVAYDEFADLYDYITRMYIKEHVTEPVTEAEAEALFNELYGEISYPNGKATTAYGIVEDDFKIPFYAHMNENGYILGSENAGAQ